MHRQTLVPAAEARSDHLRVRPIEDSLPKRLNDHRHFVDLEQSDRSKPGITVNETSVGTDGYQWWQIPAGHDHLAELVSPLLVHRIIVMRGDRLFVNQKVDRLDHDLGPSSAVDEFNRDLRRLLAQDLPRVCPGVSDLKPMHGSHRQMIAGSRDPEAPGQGSTADMPTGFS